MENIVEKMRREKEEVVYSFIKYQEKILKAESIRLKTIDNLYNSHNVFNDEILENLSSNIDSINEIPENNKKIENFFSDKSMFFSIKDLTENQKKCLYLKYVKEYEDKDIAVMMDITRQAVNKTLNKVKAKLRKLYPKGFHNTS